MQPASGSTLFSTAKAAVANRIADEDAIRAFNSFVRVASKIHYNQPMALIRTVAARKMSEDSSFSAEFDAFHRVLRERFSHWFNGHKATTKKEILADMEMIFARCHEAEKHYLPKEVVNTPNFESEFMSKRMAVANPGQKKFRNVAVPHHRPPRRNAQPKFCRYHPHVSSRARGLCPMCLNRVNKLREAGYINDRTPREAVDKILALPPMRGGSRSGLSPFQRAVQSILCKCGL